MRSIVSEFSLGQECQDLFEATFDTAKIHRERYRMYVLTDCIMCTSMVRFELGDGHGPATDSKTTIDQEVRRQTPPGRSLS